MSTVSTGETLTMAPVGTWRLDPVHSSVGFEVAYLAGKFKGEFREVDATLQISAESVTLAGAARVTSVDVKDENQAAHLQTPDFFDAERYPELRFASGDVRLDGETVQGLGELTIKGVTRPVELTGSVTPALVDPYGHERIGLTLEATVDRTGFGVSWNAPLPSGQPALANEVAIVAELQFVKAA
jgi:polyisoprenoid-binding protein YceI